MVSTVEMSFSWTVPHLTNVMPVMQRFETVIAVVVAQTFDLVDVRHIRSRDGRTRRRRDIASGAEESEGHGGDGIAHLVQPQTRLAFAVLAVALKSGRLTQ
jgi:hypothetical protein